MSLLVPKVSLVLQYYERNLHFARVPTLQLQNVVDPFYALDQRWANSTQEPFATLGISSPAHRKPPVSNETLAHQRLFELAVACM